MIRLIIQLIIAVAWLSVSASANNLSDEELLDLVKQSYQYVAMYNVNNKFAISQGGWNTIVPDTVLKDHDMRDIARPNNDTLYISALIDLRKEPAILDMPAFNSNYVSLMITGYDHYVNVPMSTREGDFDQPQKMLIFSERTEGYERGKKINGIDQYFEATGDFISAVIRIMPHANDPERFKEITNQMQEVKLLTLSEFKGNESKPIDDIVFPAVGERDFDIFENNLLEVMQFVFNHTTFNANNEIDQQLLATYKSLGIEPGQTYDEGRTTKLDGKRIRQVAEGVFAEEMARFNDKEFLERGKTELFKPKGEIGLELLLFQSISGPIGLPAQEAVYLPIITDDGKPMTAQHDYVVQMNKDAMPPAGPFWSMTLYDTENGFFIPNDHKKYSVGENAGMKLDENGGITIYIAQDKPEKVPEENWLPLNRGDYGIDVIFRIYVPDLDEFKTWTPPTAKKL